MKAKINVRVIFAFNGKIGDGMGQSRFWREMVHVVLNMFHEKLVGIKTEKMQRKRGDFKLNSGQQTHILKLSMYRRKITFGLGSSLWVGVRGCLSHCRMISYIPDINQLGISSIAQVVTAKRCLQILSNAPWEQNKFAQLRTTGLCKVRRE